MTASSNDVGAVAAPPMCVVVDGGLRESSDLREVVRGSAARFLGEVAPRGAYTSVCTARTRTAVPQLEFHLQRLIHSRRVLLAKSNGEAKREEAEAFAAADVSAGAGSSGDWTPEERAMVELVLHSLRVALTALDGESWQSALRRTQPPAENGDDDVREVVRHEAILAVAATLSSPPHVYVMAQLLPSTFAGGGGPSAPLWGKECAIEVRGGARRRPAAKDTLWISERRALERMRGADAEETVLCERSSGELLEGLTSNLFVLLDGDLYTAPDVVLPGSIRRLLIRHAEAHLGVRVRLQSPRLAEIGRWQLAFLTNARRVADAITEVRLPEHLPALSPPQGASFSVPVDPVFGRVRRLLWRLLDDTAEELFPPA